MEGYYLFISACLLFNAVFDASAWEDMCSDTRKSFSESVSLSHQAYPDYTDRKHCQCNVTTDFGADIILQLQLYREAYDPQEDAGCSPRLMVAVVDRQMQESRAQQEDPGIVEMEGIFRPSIGVCPMPHNGPATGTRTYIAMRSSQQLTVTFQNPSDYKTKFYVTLSATPQQNVRVTCGSLGIPPPALREGTAAVIPAYVNGSGKGAIIGCVIIGSAIVAILIIAYCRVKYRRRNRHQSGTPNSNPKRPSILDKITPKKGKGNPGFEGTPSSSLGDLPKSKPSDLDGTWTHPSGKDGMNVDLIPHDFLKRIADSRSPDPDANGGSPRQISGYHHEPASVPTRSQPAILSPAPALSQPGYPYQPIMDPIFAATPERDARQTGSRVSFHDIDQDSFDSPYNKPVPGSPSLNAPSDSGYTGSETHYPSRPNYDDTISEISNSDELPFSRSPDSARPNSQTSGNREDRNHTPDYLQKYPVGTKMLPHPYSNQPNEYANLAYDPDENEQLPIRIPIKEYPDNCSPPLIKEYPDAPVIPLKEYPTHSVPSTKREYPTDPEEDGPRKGVSPMPVDQHPDYAYPDEPTKQAPTKKKKKKGPKNASPQEPEKRQSQEWPTPPPPQSPELPSPPQSPEQSKEPILEILPSTPVVTPVEREYTPDIIQQFRPISPDSVSMTSPCMSPANMSSGSRTPMGRSPYLQSPVIPPLGIDDGPYLPPSPWRMPYFYKQEPLMYIDETDTESVVSSMSNRDLYVRSHKGVVNRDGSVTPVRGLVTPVKDLYRPSYHRTLAQNRPETISETDV